MVVSSPKTARPLSSIAGMKRSWTQRKWNWLGASRRKTPSENSGSRGSSHVCHALRLTWLRRRWRKSSQCVAEGEDGCASTCAAASPPRSVFRFPHIYPQRVEKHCARRYSRVGASDDRPGKLGVVPARAGGECRKETSFGSTPQNLDLSTDR